MLGDYTKLKKPFIKPLMWAANTSHNGGGNSAAVMNELNDNLAYTGTVWGVTITKSENLDVVIGVLGPNFRDDDLTPINEKKSHLHNAYYAFFRLLMNFNITDCTASTLSSGFFAGSYCDDYVSLCALIKSWKKFVSDGNKLDLTLDICIYERTVTPETAKQIIAFE